MVIASFCPKPFPILLIHKRFWAASKTPISRLGKKSLLLAIFWDCWSAVSSSSSAPGPE
jgi:hypothetical protein